MYALYARFLHLYAAIVGVSSYWVRTSLFYLRGSLTSRLRLGWGGCVAIIFVNRFGRLPVLFWSQVVLVVAWSCAPLIHNTAGSGLGISSRSNPFPEPQDIHKYGFRHDPKAGLLTTLKPFVA